MECTKKRVTMRLQKKLLDLGKTSNLGPNGFAYTKWKKLALFFMRYARIFCVRILAWDFKREFYAYTL